MSQGAAPDDERRVRMVDGVRTCRRRRWGLVPWTVVLWCGTAVSAPAQGSSTARLLQLAAENPRLQLEERRHEASGTTVLQGTYRVFEDRTTRTGRTIDLNLLVLPALAMDSAPDPVFVLHGGPGAAATDYLGGMAKSWLRERRDIVLVDQRGTGRSNPLHVDLPDGREDPQVYLGPIFVPEYFAAALPRLRTIADLTKYTTPIAMDDLNEVREALGYDVINLRGGSYGSRAALVYLRRHPATARTATLNGIAPVSFLNPLYHAAAAQEGLETLAAECASDPHYRAAFPDLLRMVTEILARLDDAPVHVTVDHPDTGKPVEVTLDRHAFAEALRVLMYYTGTNREVPALLVRAHAGDFGPFAQRGLESNRGLRNILCFGMLMCVTGSEDIPRIDPASIPELTKDTFLGDTRVRMQMAVAEVWPRGDVPAGYGRPVDVAVPGLLWSGTHDPVTPPRWGEEAARYLPHGRHLVVPGAHGVGGECVTRIEREFLETGLVEDLDVDCVSTMRLPPLKLPKRDV